MVAFNPALTRFRERSRAVVVSVVGRHYDYGIVEGIDWIIKIVY